MYEIFLTKKNVIESDWEELVMSLFKYSLIFSTFKIYIIFKNNKVHYYIKTKYVLPASISGVNSFILKQTDIEIDNLNMSKRILILDYSNATEIKNYFRMRKNSDVDIIEIKFRKISKNKVFHNIKINTNRNIYKPLFISPYHILSINFEGMYDYNYSSAPKYLDINKSLHLFKTNKANSIFEVDTFPYLQGNYYLEQNNIDFFKHSIVFGASGCGKSKFLSLMINNIYSNDLFKNKYKVVVIDPHASLENDIGGIGSVIDFNSDIDSINLFTSSSKDIVISVELILDVIKSLIPNNYNSKLERVLRFSIYLLLLDNQFNFHNLRKLLNDLDYRNEILKRIKDICPISILEFFLTEFNDIKTKSYTEAIAPIVALIDELDLIPVFNKDIKTNDLKDIINNNFLTLFSLDRTKLGDKASKTISGLIMTQLLSLIQNNTFNEHIIFIVDEVAVIENPILNRFLSEARKYNLSIILAGQYFGGISESLKKCIFANVVNYYMFRVSMDDANTLTDNFNMKIPLSDTKEEKVKMLTTLQNRECIIRISSNNVLLPAMKCKTLDFNSIPRIKKDYIEQPKEEIKNSKISNFVINNNIDLKSVISSTGR